MTILTVQSTGPAHTPIDDSAAESGFGRWVVLAFAALMLGSATLFHMDAAAYAEGSITVAGNRQVVQHRDGGIVSALLVREGQHVQAGQVLIELACAELCANERALAGQVIGLQAERARLVAERAGGNTIAWPDSFARLSLEDRQLADAAMKLQAMELDTRRHAASARRQILGQQVAQLNARIGGISEQIKANRRQSELLNDQLGGLRKLAARGFANLNTVRDLERAGAALGGETSNLSANAVSAREQIGEARLQMMAVENQNMVDLTHRLPEIDASLSEALPKWISLRRQVDEQRIRATASGQIVGLTAFTVGGVVAPGQKLMEIVPDAKPLVVQMNLLPGDADDIAVGQSAELRFPSLHDRNLPVVHAQVVRLSADSFTDEKTGARYYTGEVSVPAADIAAIRQLRGNEGALRPGLPAQVVVPLRKRTLLQYLIEPLQQGIWRSGGER